MGEEGYWEALPSCLLGISTASLAQGQLISLLQQHVLTLHHHSQHCFSCTEPDDISTSAARADSTPSQHCFSCTEPVDIATSAAHADSTPSQHCFSCTEPVDIATSAARADSTPSQSALHLLYRASWYRYFSSTCWLCAITILVLSDSSEFPTAELTAGAVPLSQTWGKY